MKEEKQEGEEEKEEEKEEKEEEEEEEEEDEEDTVQQEKLDRPPPSNKGIVLTSHTQLQSAHIPLLTSDQGWVSLSSSCCSV